MWFQSSVIHSTRLADLINPIIKIVACIGAPGSGKNSLLDELFKRDPRLPFMKSVTTRPRRKSDPPEGDPKLEYEFVSTDVFTQFSKQNLMAWEAEVHGFSYGTKDESIRNALISPHATLLHLQPGSVPTLLKLAGKHVCLMYVCVPFEQLVPRLYGRDTDKGEDYFRKRLEDCQHWESDAWHSDLPYHFIDNRDGRFEHAKQRVIDIITRR